jgi:hypothetical protein
MADPEIVNGNAPIRSPAPNRKRRATRATDLL